jgi:CRISPR-associated protein Cmr1
MTNNSSEITLTTLTPIWTGGADGKSEHLHLTGIIGSLRWWYEVLIRSVGGKVCDPGKHSCIYDHSKPDNGICDVCRVFGTTGWARRFKLVVVQDDLKPKRPVAATIGRDANLVFNLSSPSGHRWYLPGNPLDGQVTLKIVATGFLDEESKQIFDPNIIGGLFQLIAHRASLGAKPQMGLGVVRLTKQQSMQPLIDHLERVISKHQQKNNLITQVDEAFPCLQNMFFARVNSTSTRESSTFDLKYDLRAMFRVTAKYGDMGSDLRDDEKGMLRHTIMGYVRGNERIGAKIMMSYPYDNGTIRLWGWIPKLSKPQVPLNDILTEIYYFLEDEYGEVDEYGKKSLPSWLDYDPQRNGRVLRYISEYLVEGIN